MEKYAAAVDFIVSAWSERCSTTFEQFSTFSTFISAIGSGMLVDIVHKLSGLCRREVDLVRGAVPPGNANGKPAGARAESRLALDKSA
jgi:hypothetical protein